MTPLRKPIRRLDECGASTIEFAIIAPVFLTMVVGGMHLSILGFTASNLHYAAEQGARCGAVQKTRCTSATSAQSAASRAFNNFSGETVTFTATPTATCGYRMVGSLTYRVSTGISTINVPLRAAACYPV